MKKDYIISKKIYSKDKIKEAIIAFKDVSKIEYKIKDSSLIIEWENKNEIEDIFNEFMNYIIYLEC